MGRLQLCLGVGGCARSRLWRRHSGDFALVRVYNEIKDGPLQPVWLHQAARNDEADRTFHAAIAQRLAGKEGSGVAGVWQVLSARIATALDRRQRHHRETFLG